MQRKSPLITVNPVRAILKRAKELGGAFAIRNALWACGYAQCYIRHTPITRILGSMPKPALERVLKAIQ
jgi:hypothetical protein